MSWVSTELENYVETELTKDFGTEKGNELFSAYRTARPKVLREIERIATTEPNLTDHGPRHIQDVMNRAFSIISSDRSSHGLEAGDLYILLQSILFHDVGNLHGRKRHNENVGRMFDATRGTGDELRREKNLVISTARAHSGLSSAGDKNTLIELDDNAHSPFGPIKLQSIAAVLRLADELAEGEQRTTKYFREMIGVDNDSNIFHDYARCTSTMADRSNGRICLTYDIYVDDYFSGPPAVNESKLVELFGFMLHRIEKLDEERRYTRYYSTVLAPFNRTQVQVNFSVFGEPLAYGIAFALDDLVVPGQNGDSTKEIVQARFGLVKDVVDSLQEALNAQELPGEN